MTLGNDKGFWIPGLHRMLFQLFVCPVAAVWCGVAGLVDWLAVRGAPPAQGDFLDPNLQYLSYESRVGTMHHHLAYAGVCAALFLQYLWKLWRMDRRDRARQLQRAAA